MKLIKVVGFVLLCTSVVAGSDTYTALTVGEHTHVCIPAKTGSTSVLRWLFMILTGEPFPRPESIHHVFYSFDDDSTRTWAGAGTSKWTPETPYNESDSYFVVIRDPVERFRSAYMSKVRPEGLRLQTESSYPHSSFSC